MSHVWKCVKCNFEGQMYKPVNGKTICPVCGNKEWEIPDRPWYTYLPGFKFVVVTEQSTSIPKKESERHG